MFPLSHQNIGGYTFGQMTWYGARHLGVDYSANFEVLKAPFTGTIYQVQLNRWDVGNMIILKPDNSPYWIRMMHLSKVEVTAGERVTEGQEIGITGDTGLSTAPHLHIDITSSITGQFWNNFNNFINPETFDWGSIAITTSAPAVPQFAPFLEDLSPSQIYRDEVKRVQEFLIWQGFMVDQGQNDGYYGPITQAAVNGFQKAHGIEALPNYFGWWYPMSRDQANIIISKTILS